MVLGEGDRTVGDVGVAVDVVGVGVVPVVLGDPPAVAEADQQVRVHAAEQVVDALGAGDLPVSGVVPDEPGLGEHHREEGGGHQLPPRLPDQGERGPAGGHQKQVRADLDGVVARPPLQQPALLHLAGQCGVVAAAADGRGLGRRDVARRRLGAPVDDLSGHVFPFRVGAGRLSTARGQGAGCGKARGEAARGRPTARARLGTGVLRARSPSRWRRWRVDAENARSRVPGLLVASRRRKPPTRQCARCQNSAGASTSQTSTTTTH